MANRLERASRTSNPKGLLTKEATDSAGAGPAETGAVVCRSCKYENRVSYAFFILAVQNLYCRRCGRMIDRAGRPALPA